MFPYPYISPFHEKTLHGREYCQNKNFLPSFPQRTLILIMAPLQDSSRGVQHMVGKKERKKGRKEEQYIFFLKLRLVALIRVRRIVSLYLHNFYLRRSSSVPRETFLACNFSHREKWKCVSELPQLCGTQSKRPTSFLLHLKYLVVIWMSGLTVAISKGWRSY